MNKVFLIGNLTKDPDVRTTATGKKVVSFSLAIRDGKDASGNEVTQYFNCTAWEKLADIIDQYVKKGHKIAINGALKNRSWDGPDGVKKYATDILASDIELLTSRAESERISQTAGSDSSPEAKKAVSKPATKVASVNVPEINLDEIDVDISNMPF